MKKIIGGVIIFTVMFFLPSIVNAAPANPAFTDDEFYACVVDNYNKENDTDYGYDTNLTDAQLESIQSLYCVSEENVLGYPVHTFVNTTGIEKMTGLTNIGVMGQRMTAIDLSQNTNLTYVGFANTLLQSLDLTRNSKLQSIELDNNRLTVIDWNSQALESVDITESSLSSLDFSRVPNILILHLQMNSLESLNIRSLTQLQELWVIDTPITVLDFSSNQNLNDLSLTDTKITSVDFSSNSALREVSLVGNPIENYNFGTGESLTTIRMPFHAGERLDFRSYTSLEKVELDMIGMNEESIVALNPGVNVIMWNITDEAYFNSLIQSVTNPAVASDNGEGGFITTGKGTSLITLENNSTFRLLVGEGDINEGFTANSSDGVNDTIENPNTGVDEYSVLIIMGVVMILGGSIYRIAKKKSMLKTM